MTLMAYLDQLERISLYNEVGLDLITLHVPPYHQNDVYLILSCNVVLWWIQLSVQSYHFFFMETPKCTPNLGRWYLLHTFFLGMLVHILECYYFLWWGIYCHFILITPRLLCWRLQPLVTPLFQYLVWLLYYLLITLVLVVTVFINI